MDCLSASFCARWDACSSARVDFTAAANGLGFTQQALNGDFDLFIQLGRVYLMLLYNVFVKRGGNALVHPFREMRAQIGQIEQRLLSF